MAFYVMDTDHLSLYERNHPFIRKRILATQQSDRHNLVTTVVTVEEQCAGRLAQIRKAITIQTLAYAYDCLKATINLFADLEVLGYDIRSDEYFQELRKSGLRIGTQDLRIDSIVLAHNGILLTRNPRDFEKIAELSIEDWLI